MKTAVVGVGHLGKLHAKMYKRIPGSELVGIYDVNSEQTQLVADELGVPAFSSLRHVFDNAEAVSIVTPTTYHFSSAKLCLQHGLHVFIEKPITTTIEEAKQITKLAEHHKRKLQVGHIERFNPAILALEKYNIQPLFIESHRLAQFKLRGADVAVVLDLMIHDIDIILHLVKSPVVRIDANGIGIISDNIDIANARIQFENGCVANVTASRISQRPMRKMRIFQKDAYLSVDFSEGSCDVFRLTDQNEPTEKLAMMLGQIDAGTHQRNIIYEQPEVKEINALEHELTLFLDAIKNDTETAVTGYDGLQALEVAQQIIKTIEENNQKLKTLGIK